MNKSEAETLNADIVATRVRLIALFDVATADTVWETLGFTTRDAWLASMDAQTDVAAVVVPRKAHRLGTLADRPLGVAVPRPAT